MLKIVGDGRPVQDHVIKENFPEVGAFVSGDGN
jgi:hypothetical protein